MMAKARKHFSKVLKIFLKFILTNCVKRMVVRSSAISNDDTKSLD